MRYRLPEIVSLFGCAAALRPVGRSATQASPKATKGSVPARIAVRQHPAPSVPDGPEWLVFPDQCDIGFLDARRCLTGDPSDLGQHLRKLAIGDNDSGECLVWLAETYLARPRTACVLASTWVSSPRGPASGPRSDVSHQRDCPSRASSVSARGCTNSVAETRRDVLRHSRMKRPP